MPLKKWLRHFTAILPFRQNLKKVQSTFAAILSFGENIIRYIPGFLFYMDRFRSLVNFSPANRMLARLERSVHMHISTVECVLYTTTNICSGFADQPCLVLICIVQQCLAARMACLSRHMVMYHVAIFVHFFVGMSTWFEKPVPHCSTQWKAYIGRHTSVQCRLHRPRSHDGKSGIRLVEGMPPHTEDRSRWQKAVVKDNRTDVPWDIEWCQSAGELFHKRRADNLVFTSLAAHSYSSLLFLLLLLLLWATNVRPTNVY